MRRGHIRPVSYMQTTISIEERASRYVDVTDEENEEELFR